MGQGICSKVMMSMFPIMEAVFYPISLVCDCLDDKTEQALVKYMLNIDKFL